MANRVGGEVDGFCTKCRMILAHTILAMVGERVARVKCNTCGGEHAFKAAEPTATSMRASRPKTSASSGGSRSRAKEVNFDEALAQKNVSAARTYAVSDKYAVGDLVSHPTFGLGIVEAARSDKIDVTFRSFVKTLLHGRAGGPTKPPSFARPAPAPAPEAELETAAESEPVA